MIADNYDHKFEPLSNSKVPSCLLPVANVPVLHYVIEFLLINQVKEIIIVTGRHRKEIQNFVREQEYKKHVKIDVKQIKPESESLGDALRETSELHCMKDEFLVVRGDIITNINLQEALKMHWTVKAMESQSDNVKTAFRKNKTIMTKLFVRQSNLSKLRNPNTDIMLMLDSQTKEIYKYHSIVQENHKVVKTMKLNDEHIAFAKSYGHKDTELHCNNAYKKAISMELRHDLVDTEIAICSNVLLDHFNDNFDKATLKDGFINWMNESEIIEDRTRAFEVQQQGVYMARLVDPRHYGVITQDVLARRAYPLVIDKAALDSKSAYLYEMNHIYIDQAASLDVTVSVSGGCAIARQVVIDAGAKIVQSVIGSNSSIGKNVTIENSIIDKNVKINDNAKIVNAILQSGAVIGQNCNIESGAIVASNVVLKDDVTIPRGKICSMFAFDPDTQQYEEVPEENFNKEFFVKGTFTNPPYDRRLNETELLGARFNYDKEESDLDLSEEEEEEDPFEQFSVEVSDLFDNCLENKKMSGISQKEFIKQLTFEVRSLKLTFNIQS